MNFEIKFSLIYLGIGIVAAVITYPFRTKLGAGNEPAWLWFPMITFLWPVLLAAALMVPFIKAWDWHTRPMSKGMPVGMRIRKAMRVLIGRE